MKARLNKICTRFLQEPEHFDNLSRTSADFKALLMECAALDLNDDDSRNNIPLKQGMALGTTWAAYCVDDLLRTKRFIKGIYHTIQHLISQKGAKSVHLLYAGTGPYATLVLPLIAKFSPEELQFTFLEINPISYQNLERVIQFLKMEPYIRRFELADATEYRLPKGEKVDILLSETMQAGLRREAQVPIFRNLLRQAEARDAILIPERIELFLGAYCSRVSTMEKEAIKWGSYFCLDRDHLLTGLDTLSENYPVVTIPVPDAHEERYDKMAIFTEIDIAYGQSLRLHESGLTIPLMIRDLHQDPLAGGAIQISYQLNEEPGELIEFVNQTV